MLEHVGVGKKAEVLSLEGKEESIIKLRTMGIREGKVLEVVHRKTCYSYSS